MTEEKKKSCEFYGADTACVKDVRGLTPRDYYGLLSDIWSADTCAPRMRGEWTPENKTLGQCSVTAFLMQDIYGGKVYGIPLGDGAYHCFNAVGDCVFDLTDGQFGGAELDYANAVEQSRGVHFAKEEKKERYRLLRERLFAVLPPAMETERLILRPWLESDAEECFRYAKDPEVGPPAGWAVHSDVEYTRNIIRDVLSAPETYAIVLKETGLPVGSVGLHMKTDIAVKENECELGYWIGRPYWGRGLVPEAAREMLRHAFEDLKFEKVWCAYYDGNVKSKRVQEKCGFKYQWTTEKVDVPQLHDTRKGHVNCLTKEEWRKNAMEEQTVTITVKTRGEKCEMSDAEIKEWYESHVRAMFDPAYGSPEISVELKRETK